MKQQKRIDQWLWAVRLYKTRSLAANACRDGLVRGAGERVTPARDGRGGEIVCARAQGVQRTVKVLGLPPGRLAAKLVPEFLEDLTPAAEYEKARAATPPPQFNWSKGFARPTKKSRRLWEDFNEQPPE